MRNFGLLTAEIGSKVWGTPANFNGFRVLASLLHRRRSREVSQIFARWLAVSWAGTLYLWSPYVIGQTIIFLGCNFYLLSFFFPRLISVATDWMSTILLHMAWPYSANLECRSEMCCSWLAANTGRKKVAKNRHLGTIAQLRRAISSQLRHVSTIGKKTC